MNVCLFASHVHKKTQQEEKQIFLLSNLFYTFLPKYSCFFIYGYFELILLLLSVLDAFFRSPSVFLTWLIPVGNFCKHPVLSLKTEECIYVFCVSMARVFVFTHNSVFLHCSILLLCKSVISMFLL